MKTETLYKVNVVVLLLVLWCIPWYVYNRFIRTKTFHPMSVHVLPTPHWMSCGIPYVSKNEKKNKCENVKIDGWSVGHVLIYITIGMVLPGYWAQILLLSIACEAFEYAVGWRARWIIDPVANLFGYLLGHVVYVNLRDYKWISKVETTVVMLAGLAFILFMNRPCMIPRGNEFY
jgi:hypothetical protein